LAARSASFVFVAPRWAATLQGKLERESRAMNKRRPFPRHVDARTPPEAEVEASAPDIDDECWDVLVPDDDYEPIPEPGDFWTDQDPTRPRGSS
jgi:hypothetical protein